MSLLTLYRHSILAILIILAAAHNSYGLSSISKLTNGELIMEDESAYIGYSKTGLYVRGVTKNNGVDTPSQFYIGYPPTSSATTTTSPQVMITGQESDKTLIMFSLNGQSMTSFSSGFDLQNNNKNKLFLNSRGTPVMTFTGKGYIGIGTTNPSDFFHVEGDMYVKGTVFGMPKISDIDTIATSNPGRPLAMQVSVGTGGLDNTTNLTAIYADVSTSESPNTGDILTLTFKDADTKLFVINHPLDKQKYLIHSALEGPENGVRYRGTTTLKQGKGSIKLPNYVSKFTDPTTATLHLISTDTGEALRIVYTNGKWLQNNTINIESENKNSTKDISWTFQATRKDISPLVVTPPKNLVKIGGFGPYKIVKGYDQL
jgi:hypothetical protein